jgi:SAM-dependent methyltransferase
VLLAARDAVAGEPFDVVGCESCRHAYTWPVPGDLGAYYPPTYWSGEANGLVSRLEDAYRRALVGLDVRRVADQVARGSRVLDVGCGSGDLAASLARAGYAMRGVEVAPDAARVARERHGLDVTTGTLAEAAFPDGHFDAAVVWHVLEHVPDPPNLLREVWRVVRPGGRLVVQVPSFDSFQARLFRTRWFALDVPRHLHHFTPRSLTRTLERAGFETAPVRHGSLRYDPVILASSLWPKMGPHGLAGGAATAKAAYLALTWLVAPLTVLEAALRRGAVITAVATRTPGRQPES